jgi:hypothetical protein
MPEISKYMDGECHVIAVALHRRTGSAFLLLCEDAGDYRNDETGDPVPSVHHVYGDLQDGTLADIRGIHDRDDVVAQWEAMNDEAGGTFRVVELDTEEELAAYVCDGWDLPLTTYSEDDVAAADALFMERHPNFSPGAPLRRR